MEGNMRMWTLISIEDQLIKATISILLRDGFTLGVFDGEEMTVRQSTNPDLIFTSMKTTDEDYIYTFKPGDMNPRSVGFGWVRFVYGNDGIEVINDYTTTLDAQMAVIYKMIDEYEKKVGG